MPVFIVSFSLGCQNLENNPLRYLLITSYFFSFNFSSICLPIVTVLGWEWCTITIDHWISVSSQRRRSLGTATTSSPQCSTYNSKSNTIKTEGLLTSLYRTSFKSCWYFRLPMFTLRSLFIAYQMLKLAAIKPATCRQHKPLTKF